MKLHVSPHSCQIHILAFMILAMGFLSIAHNPNMNLKIDIPKIGLQKVPLSLKIHLPNLYLSEEIAKQEPRILIQIKWEDNSNNVTLDLSQQQTDPSIETPITFSRLGDQKVSIAATLVTSKTSQSLSTTTQFIYIWPGLVSIIPAVATIMFAVWLKENILCLLLGCWIANTFINKGNVIAGVLRTVDHVVIESMTNSDHACIIYFILLIGGMIAVINKSGSMLGMARVVTKYAKTKKSAELVTAFIGCVSFFDDVASALIAGSVMKEITGRLKTSREKLSFIVDTCAATVPSMIVVSSWIGVELSYIKDGFNDIKLDRDPYITFIQTIAYRFYPMLMLVFCFMVIISGRDFGPMWKAERRAFISHKLVKDGAQPLSPEDDPEMKPKEGIPYRWCNAVIPFALVMVTIFVGIVVQGNDALSEKAAKFQGVLDSTSPDSEEWKNAKSSLDGMDFGAKAIFGAANPFYALIWASLVGSLAIIALVLIQRIMTLGEAMQSWTSGCKSMVFVVMILIHAWTFGSSCRQLQAAQFIVSSLQGSIPASLLPLLVFILGAIVSFSIGSAWGTMAILFPIVIPLANDLARGNMDIMLGTIASVLSGSALGNHTSPIADCCIMSSMSTGSDHNDHIRTQGVYAVVVALVSMVTGSLPVGFGFYPAWVGMIIGALTLVGLLWMFGRRSDFPCSTSEMSLRQT